MSDKEIQDLASKITFIDLAQDIPKPLSKTVSSEKLFTVLNQSSIGTICVYWRLIAAIRSTLDKLLYYEKNNNRSRGRTLTKLGKELIDALRIITDECGENLGISISLTFSQCGRFLRGIKWIESEEKKDEALYLQDILAVYATCAGLEIKCFDNSIIFREKGWKLGYKRY